MEIEGHLVYYNASDGDDVGHKVFIDNIEAVKYAVELASKMVGKDFKAYHEMVEWFNANMYTAPVDPGRINIVEVKIKNKDKDKDNNENQNI